MIRRDDQRHSHGIIRVCFVCLGNICRSPTAEALLRQLVDRAGLHDRILIDSAGTSAYHAGASADSRSTATAADHGVVLAGVSRQFVIADFDRFDHIVAMDAANAVNLRALARDSSDVARVSLLRQWSADHVGPDRSIDADVPDPYYDADDGFETVFDICRSGCAGIFSSLRVEVGESP